MLLRIWQYEEPTRQNQQPATTPKKPKYLVVEDRGYFGKVIRFRIQSKYVVIAIIRQKPSTARTRAIDLERYQSEYENSNGGGAYAQLCQALEDIKTPYSLEIQKPYKELIDKNLITDQKQDIANYLQYLVTETNLEHQKALKDLSHLELKKQLMNTFHLLELNQLWKWQAYKPKKRPRKSSSIINNINSVLFIIKAVTQILCYCFLSKNKSISPKVTKII